MNEIDGIVMCLPWQSSRDIPAEALAKTRRGFQTETTIFARRALRRAVDGVWTIEAEVFHLGLTWRPSLQRSG